MLPASLAAELDITQEEMDSFAEDMYSVFPGCRRVKLATSAARSVIAYIFNTTTLAGHELQDVWLDLHSLDRVMEKVEKWFGGDMTPPKLESPKHNVLGLINICLDIVSGIGLILDDYGQTSQAEAHHRLLAWSLLLRKAIAATLKLMPDPRPLLKAEDCHEGMELPTDLSSSLQPSQAGEGLEDELLSGSPAHTPDSDQSPPTNPQEGPGNGSSSSSNQPESHDETWTFCFHGGQMPYGG